MEPIVSRYEFRVWADELAEASARLRSLSAPGAARNSEETYLPTIASVEVNAKVRESLLDIKTLDARSDGFERWTPRTKTVFPLAAATVGSELFRFWGFEAPELSRSHYTLEQLIDEVVNPHPGLAAVTVKKRRQAFLIDGCIAEVADVMIDTRSVQTVAIESADLAALRGAVQRAGLETQTNTSYPQIIRETLGWAPA